MFYVRCVATGATGRHVATRTVGTAADEHNGDKQKPLQQKIWVGHTDQASAKLIVLSTTLTDWDG